MENNEEAKQEPKPELIELSNAFSRAVKKHYPESTIVLCVMTDKGSVFHAQPDVLSLGVAEYLKQEIYKNCTSES